MVSEKFIEILKEKATKGEVWAINKLKSLGQTRSNSLLLPLSDDVLYYNTGNSQDNSLKVKPLKRKRAKLYSSYCGFKTTPQIKDWLKSKGNISKFINGLLNRYKQQLEKKEHEQSTNR